MQPLDRNALTLATSLLKDKLKYDFQTLDKTQIANYYQQLSKVSELIQVLLSQLSATIKQLSPT